jgi:4-alpha-glucanotransferase
MPKLQACTQDCRDLAAPEYKRWFAANADWLEPYAVFCFLKDLHATADHRDWGALHRNGRAHVARLADPAQPFHADLRFTFWLQWRLHLQLAEAAAHAAARRVVLKGDLPIGVAKESCDTWVDPQLFRMDVGVGSPPDAFDPRGQNWGFPGATWSGRITKVRCRWLVCAAVPWRRFLACAPSHRHSTPIQPSRGPMHVPRAAGYNWEEMAKDGYGWWRRRLSHMGQYFSAYRVDHILGFFRVYEARDRLPRRGGALLTRSYCRCPCFLLLCTLSSQAVRVLHSSRRHAITLRMHEPDLLEGQIHQGRRHRRRCRSATSRARSATSGRASRSRAPRSSARASGTSSASRSPTSRKRSCAQRSATTSRRCLANTSSQPASGRTASAGRGRASARSRRSRRRRTRRRGSSRCARVHTRVTQARVHSFMLAQVCP